MSVASIPRVKYAFCVANVKVKSVNVDSILLTGILLVLPVFPLF